MPQMLHVPLPRRLLGPELLLPLLVLAASPLACAGQTPVPTYRVIDRIETAGEGGWDYLAVDTAHDRLFVSRSTHVQVVDLSGDSLIADMPDTPGVHGIALAPDLGRGFISNGRDSTVTIFDLETLAPTGRVKVTGRNPDAILYEPVTHRVFAFNHSSGDATALDATSGRVLGTIELGGSPEFAVSDQGTVYVNIEDRSEIAVIDARTLKVQRKWPLAPCEEPTGLALNVAHHLLFAGCGNELMAVVDAGTGTVRATLPIGAGVDATRFDQATGLAFSSNGEGTLTVVREASPDSFVVQQTVRTARGARTMELDPRTHRLYLSTARFQAAPADSAGARRRPRPVPGSFIVLVVGS